jgi:2-oxoglutarate ferredoxin oxidoreductase subunit alpha
MANEIVFRIGGAAGDGVSSAAESFAKLCTRHGLYVWTYSSYQSVIRGGHAWTQVRVSDGPVLSQGEDPHVLVALNQQTADIHAPQVVEGGAILHDEDLVTVDEGTVAKGVRIWSMPLVKVGREKTGVVVAKNIVALGAVLNLLDLDMDVLVGILEQTFGHKKRKVVEGNVAAARAGWQWAQEHGGSLGVGFAFSQTRRMMITGNHAICLGAVAAGCKFLAQYPMTPASSILHWMAAHAKETGVVVKQVEDELAAINMAIGAGFAGVRAMTATSGGGFSLMVEALGEAGMTETPVVAVLAQRGGPSTGLPTKTEQGDLNLVLGAGQGDWPRIVIAPRNVEECFHHTARAFNLADMYQTPVILVSDLYLSEGYRTVEPDAFDFDVPIQRGLLAEENTDGGTFLRYKITDSGVSPRSLPGTKGLQYVAGTDEHREDSHLISDWLAGVPEWVDMRRRMHEKRMRKLETAWKDMEPPELWGPADADLTVVSWGSSQGPVREAVTRINAANGDAANSLEFRDLWPLPWEEVAARLEACTATLMVEANISGQMEALIRSQTGFKMDHRLRKYDGEPFSPREIAARIEEVLHR